MITNYLYRGLIKRADVAAARALLKYGHHAAL